MPIQHIGNKDNNNAPLASEILERQIAINLNTGKLYTKDHNGDVIELSPTEAVQVINDLTTAATDKPLSANMGKELKGMIDAINTLLASDNTSLDEMQEVVDYIIQNRNTLNSLGIGNISGLQDALDAKEDAFAKNSAFNKNFGTGSEDVARGNHSHDAGYFTGS